MNTNQIESLKSLLEQATQVLNRETSHCEQIFLDLPESDERFARCLYLVEATSHEQFMLWQETSNEARYLTRDDKDNELRNPDGLTWSKNNSGSLCKVGELGGYALYVCVTFTEINGKLIAFYYPTSKVSHFGITETWLKARCPAILGMSDAQNFPNAVRALGLEYPIDSNKKDRKTRLLEDLRSWMRKGAPTDAEFYDLLFRANGLLDLKK